MNKLLMILLMTGLLCGLGLPFIVLFNILLVPVMLNQLKHTHCPYCATTLCWESNGNGICLNDGCTFQTKDDLKEE